MRTLNISGFELKIKKNAFGIGIALPEKNGRNYFAQRDNVEYRTEGPYELIELQSRIIGSTSRKGFWAAEYTKQNGIWITEELKSETLQLDTQSITHKAFDFLIETCRKNGFN